MHKKLTLALAAALVTLGSAAFAADEPPDSSAQARQARMDAALRDEESGRPAADQSLGSRIHEDATEAGHAIRNGAHRAGHAVSHAASATGHAVSHAASATGHAVSNGVHRTGAAIHNATHRTHATPAARASSSAS